jgi:hypothetical protein
MSNLRTQLTTECERFFSSAESEELLHLLWQGGYCLEVAFEQGLEKGQIPIAFVFDNRIFKTRLELAVARKTEQQRPRPSRSEMASDLANVAKRLFALSGMPHFRPIGKLIVSAMKAASPANADQTTTDSETWELNFEVEGIWLLGIYCDRYASGRLEFGVDDVITDPADILDALPAELAFLKIPEQTWYAKLSMKTQAQVQLGTSFIEKVYPSEKGGLEDFSPLLLSFFKAAEAEIAEHFQRYAAELINISGIIAANYSSDGNGSPARTPHELKGLIKQAENIKEIRFNFKPSGTKSLYYFLKFYALRASISHLPFDPYLEPEKIRFLRSMEHGLGWLKALGNSRNSLVHERPIDQEDEFLRHYDGICRLLRLLVKLKEGDLTGIE